MLAFVIDRAPRPIARDLLMEVFWPASTPDAARNSLHVAIRAVRKALSHAWPGVVIECRGDTYRLAESVSLWTDVAELERRSEWAAEVSARGRDDEAMQHYEAALALYGEEFLADDPYLEWAIDRREEIRLRAVSCAERLSALHLERGDLRRALVVSSQVLREEPCHEPVARRLMVAYAAPRRAAHGAASVRPDRRRPRPGPGCRARARDGGPGRRHPPAAAGVTCLVVSPTSHAATVPVKSRIRAAQDHGRCR